MTIITIPSAVIRIGDAPAAGCTNLSAITVDATNAFYSSMDGVLFNKGQTSLIQYPAGKSGSTYIIPSTVTSIGYGAFNSCTRLTGVTISSNVTQIASHAFRACTSLADITIPNRVTSIGHYAFAGCNSLTSLAIPASVTSILAGFAPSCTNLSAITVDATNAFYSSVDGVLFDKSQTLLVQYPSGKSGNTYIIPASVTSIWFRAFAGCTGLTGVTIPLGVTDIGSSAFSSCTSLTRITIPGNVTNIGDTAFDYSSLIGAYFQGNAPAGTNALNNTPNATVYYLPGTTGWTNPWSGRPTALWLAVNGGSAMGPYTDLQRVTITADAPAAGKTFDRWSGATQYVASITSSTTTVALPEQAVALTATYKDLYCTLIVDAAHGTPIYPVGTNVYVWGTIVTCSVDNITSDGWMFMGWTGDVSTGYTATNTVVVMDALFKSMTAQYSNDADSDGLLNNIELFIGTNPRMKDTDGDKFDDSFEIAQDMNPLTDNSAIRSYIQSNHETFGLYASNAVLDVAVGEVLMNAQNGQAKLRLQVEQSNDLQSWTNAGDTVEWSLPLDGNKKFFRVKASK